MQKGAVMKQIKFFLKLAIVFTITFFVVGCISSKPVPAPVIIDKGSCQVPSGHLVDQAFATAKATLSNPNCKYQFNSIFSALLDICAGSPDIKNKTQFSNFLMWCKNNGIINTVQAKKQYTTYFSDKFVSLPDDYQTCSYCSRMKTVLNDCWSEIKSKELGLLKACNDSTTYNKAYNDMQKIELILEATCDSCAPEF